jgi:hypothetical protein
MLFLKQFRLSCGRCCVRSRLKSLIMLLVLCLILYSVFCLTRDRIGFHYAVGMDELKNLLICGGLAGLVDALVLHPADMCKVRQQTGSGSVAAEIYRESCLRGFYRGLGPVVTTIVPKVAVRFATFHQLNEMVASKSFSSNLVCGMCAGVVEAVLVVTPSEVIKIRQQERGNESRSQWAVLRTVWSNSGLFGLYRGLGATALRQAMQQGSKFAVFYGVRDRLNSDLVAGFVANTVRERSKCHLF